MAKIKIEQLNLFEHPLAAGEKMIKAKADGLKLYDPRDGQCKVSNNPALILRNLYLRNFDGDLRVVEIIDEFICEQADIADQYLYIPDGKGSYTAF